ncbi:MAG: DUF1343 domain-containing protein [Eubacteriales bacterium]
MKKTVYNGIDNIAAVRGMLSGARIGLITGPTGVDRSLRHTSEIIASLTRLTALFSPEHGIRGENQAGGGDAVHRDPDTGATVYPIYGSVTAPTPDMLDKVDIMLYDMQDVGARFYTYLTTLTRSMQVCAARQIPFIVFDRMNPVSLSRVEGNVLSERFASFVGEYAVPVRYGLTVGEYAIYINEKKHLGCQLTVVPCEGLDRRLYFDDTDLCFVPPSPNIPTVDSAVCYLGTCIFEGTNLSEGRGTTKPFELIGAPWVDSRELTARLSRYRMDGVIFRRAFFTPVYSKYSGERCEGVEIHITDREHFQPVEAGLRLFDELRAICPEMMITQGIDHLFGDDKLRTEYIGGERIDAFLTYNENRLRSFRDACFEYRLY